MKLPPLTRARLLRRYKRFLADVELADGVVETVYVANTGSLLGCVEPGSECWLKPMSAGGKFRYGLLLVRPQDALVCVDTGVPNRVVLEAAQSEQIPQLSGYGEYIPEMPLGESSRCDLCCRVHADDLLSRCWVEVKATTLARDGRGEFPDAVTQRGRRHLVELSRRAQRGERAVQLFFVQRGDCDSFAPAEDIDPEYAAELRRAASAGVEILAVQAAITKRSIGVGRQLPVEL